MSRWDDIYPESPSRELSQRIALRVAEELKEHAPAPFCRRREWLLQFATLSLGAVAFVIGFKTIQQRQQSPSPEENRAEAKPSTDLLMLVDSVGEDSVDLELLADLEIIEQLEELEKWPNS
ncbi:MAG: hypothetical protein AB7G93_08805 [Bdellovibrionales bacterium]